MKQGERKRRGRAGTMSQVERAEKNRRCAAPKIIITVL